MKSKLDVVLERLEHFLRHGFAPSLVVSFQTT